MDLFLVHGLGRTPLSMLALRHRLARLGHRAHLFGYSPTFETLEQATGRLARRIHDKAGDRPYALAGHSLGTVLIRLALPRLEAHPPSACLFLAPPMVACRAARFFSRFRLFRAFSGEMGRLLASQDAMGALPRHPRTRIYAGVAGPRAVWLPFGLEANDGILALSEAAPRGGETVLQVPSTHTFVMNSRVVLDDLAAFLRTL